MNAANCNKNDIKKNVDNDNDMYGNEITDKEKQTRLLSILRQTTVKDTAYDAKKIPCWISYMEITIGNKQWVNIV